MFGLNVTGPMRDEFQQLIESFTQAWTLVKAHLASFGMCYRILFYFVNKVAMMFYGGLSTLHRFNVSCEKGFNEEYL